MGLLSLITNDNDLAAADLLKATNSDQADAGFFLGLINLQKGKINTAHKLFQFAEAKSTTINDNFAALAQVYFYKKQNENADKYNNLYKSKLPANLSITPTPVPLPPIVEQGETADAMPHLDSIIALQVPTDTTVKDTLAQDSTKKDTTKVATAEPEESIWEAENYLLVKYVAGIAVAAILLLVYLYLKWRNKQLLLQQQQAKEKKVVADKANAKNFSQMMEDEKKKQAAPAKATPAKEVAPKPAATAKEKAGGSKSVEEMIAANLTNPAQHKAEGVANYKKNADNLLSLIDNMKAEDVIKSDSILQAELSNANMNAGKAAFGAKKQLQNQMNTSTKPNTANVELANRLVNEQKRIQQEKLAKLDNALAIKPEKIKDIAQKIGIDKGSIETKQHLEKLLANEKEFEKLSEKFGIKQKKEQ